MILILLLFSLLASTFTLAKAVLSYTTPVFFIGVRMVVAGILLLGYLRLRKPNLLTFDRAHSRLFAQVTLLHIYGAYVFEFIGLQYVSSAKTSLLFNLMPFVSAILSHYTFGERLKLKQWGALLLGFAAFIPLLISTSSQEEATGSFLCLSWPELAILVAVLCSAQGWIVMRQLVKGYSYSPIMVNGFGMISGGALALVTSFVVEGFPRIMAKPEAIHIPLDHYLAPLVGHSALGMFMLYMVLLILIANVICYNLYGYLLKNYSATLLAFAGFTTPLFASLYGWLLLGETIGMWFGISFALVFLALYLYMRASRSTI